AQMQLLRSPVTESVKDRPEIKISAFFILLSEGLHPGASQPSYADHLPSWFGIRTLAWRVPFLREFTADPVNLSWSSSGQARCTNNFETAADWPACCRHSQNDRGHFCPGHYSRHYSGENVAEQKAK